MKNYSKLNSSLFLIKRGYSMYPSNIGATSAPKPPQPAQPTVPKAIPVAAAKPVPKAIPVARPQPFTSAPSPAKAISAPSMPPQQPKSQQPYYAPVLDVIRKAESNVAGYDTMVGSNKPHGLTSMTLQQLMEYQKKHPKGSAAGAYQIINPTLKGLINKMKLDPAQTKYDQSLQDRMALELLQQRGFNKFVEGNLPLDKARLNIAKEWAGLPIAGGQSYYKGTGNNQARVSEQDYLNALLEAKRRFQQSQRLTQNTMSNNELTPLP
jgi:muramidase (phage lysozyme)